MFATCSVLTQTFGVPAGPAESRRRAPYDRAFYTVLRVLAVVIPEAG